MSPIIAHLTTGFGVVGQALVVAVGAATAVEPGKDSFHDPAAREHLEGTLPLGFSNDLKCGSAA